MKHKTIAIIGLGQIGQRHLQSILRINNKFNLYLFDLNQKVLQLIQKNYLINKKINIFYESELNIKNLKIDILLICTTADVRLKVLQKVLKKNLVKNIIFEKPVTNNLIEYLKINKMLRIYKTNSFVNLPRRIYLVYKNIKRKLNLNDKIYIQFHSYNWNLASNIIHFLDLLSFLSSNNENFLNNKLLYKKIYNSKRKGFIEFKGRLEFEDNKNNFLSIADSPKYKNNDNVIISQKNIKFIVDEKKMKLTTLKKNKKITRRISIPFQSDITKELILDILNKKSVDLPSTAYCLNNHKIIFKTLNDHLKSLNKDKKLMIS